MIWKYDVTVRLYCASWLFELIVKFHFKIGICDLNLRYECAIWLFHFLVSFICAILLCDLNVQFDCEILLCRMAVRFDCVIWLGESVKLFDSAIRLCYSVWMYECANLCMKEVANMEISYDANMRKCESWNESMYDRPKVTILIWHIQFYQCSSSLVVMTSALHAEGREFNPLPE